MNNKNLMRRRFLLIPLVLLSCLLLFTACGDGDKGPAVTSIAIQSSDKPQTVFIKGQDLDLSSGKLTVTRDDGTTETIALNDPKVTVSGYNKDTVGEQNLVITYGEKSVPLTVSVVNRMTFMGYETEYFVGDVFNTTKGSVTIVKDDGSKVSVRLNDTAAISVVSFDSSSAGSKQVTIRYSNGSEEYTDALTVNVHNVGEIKFIRPTKTNYGSHETEMNLLGGYFQVTAEGNTSLKKFVDLTQDMVSGFDPTAATKDNVETPLKQAVMINYAGQTYQLDISITYSGVSLMQDAIRELGDVNLDVEKPSVTEEQGKTALFALQHYLKMTPAERGNISEKDRNMIARVAAMYGNAYANVLAQPFSQAVIIENGNVALNLKATRESISQAIEMLSDPKNEFIEFSLFLEEFAAEFAKVTLVEGTTIADVVKFVPEENMTYVITVLEFMLQLHDDMAGVPDNWTVEDLPNYLDNIDDAVRHIRNFENAGLIPSACSIVSSWRANDDYIEIIYSYYVNYESNRIADTLWGQVPLPGKLQELYNAVAMAANESARMQSAGLTAIWYDATGFWYYYSKCLELSEQILNGDDELCKSLFNIIQFDQIIETYCEYATVGVVNLSTSLNNNPKFAELMNRYLSLMKKYLEDEKGVSVEDDKADLQAIFDLFVDMTPAQQRAFLNALFYLYNQEEVRDNMLFAYPENEVKGMYIFFLVNYFTHQLPDSADPMLQDLLLAIEYYMNNSTYEDAMSNFMAKMDSLIIAYGTLSQADKAVFDRYLGNAYQKYLKLYKINKAGQPSDMSKFEALRDELLQALSDYEKLNANLADPETGSLNDGMMGAIVAAYERIAAIVDEMRNSDDEQLRFLASTMDVAFSEESSLPIDFAAQNVRWRFIIMLHNVTYTYKNDDETEERRFAYDIYTSADLSDFMAQASYVIIQQYNGATEFDAAKVLSIMKAYRDQMDKDSDAMGQFYTFDADFFYYAGLNSFFTKVLTEGNAALGAKLLEIEQLYTEYAFSEEDEDKTAFMDAMAEAIKLYASVTDTENFNAYLAELYNYYLNLYNTLNTAA